MTELAGALLDLAQIAHDTQIPHQEPMKGSDGGASTIVIVLGVVLTLAMVGGLVWLKKRVDAEPKEGG